MPFYRLFLILAVSVGLTLPAHAFGTAGSYLAARQASYENDYRRAAEYYTRALALDPGNAALMEAALASEVSLGEFERGLPIARRMADGDLKSQVAAMALLVYAAASEDFATVLAMLDEGRSVGGLVDSLTGAWALLGKGDAEAALAAFDEIAERDELRDFALYHKALALASVGDFEGADDIFSGRESGPLTASRRGITAHAQILSQLDRPDAAIDLIAQTFGPNPVPLMQRMTDMLQSGQPLAYDVATSARDGVAEVFYTVGSALAGETAPGYALLYARASEYLNPDHVDALLLSASLLEQVEQFDLATEAYDRVPRDHPAFVTAELGRAEALRDAERSDAAIEVLRQLAESAPDLLMVHMSLGDTLRQLDRFAESSEAYDSAIALIDDPQREHWVLWFSRGITLERTDRWDEAEADFRYALELNAGQPQVLNYLGYSLVEMDEKLAEALNMIERAVAARPNDGYITDSLGWVLYKLGRYDEAVGHMERATELQPVDPIINDHLGDVLWAVGREIEARFQWRRALSFDPEPDEAARIRRKLEVGLDRVLEEEGAAPLAVAKDG